MLEAPAPTTGDEPGLIGGTPPTCAPKKFESRSTPWHDPALTRAMVAAMTVGAVPGSEVVLETSRLLLRPWRVAEAVIQHELWTERDPRVPPHRRIDADGHPTVAELESSIRTNQLWSSGLLAIERKASRDVIGYCGLVDRERVSAGEPDWHSSCYAEFSVRDTRPRRRWRFWNGRDHLGTNVCGPRSGTGTPLLAMCWPRSDSPKPSGRRWTRCTEPTCSPRGGSDTPPVDLADRSASTR